jgi:NAD-dependent protein deacetylase/lipoamidase
LAWLGSSLVVTPAADLPQLAKRAGARPVIVNREVTPLDDLADAVLYDSIGEVLARTMARLSAVSRQPAWGRRGYR